MIDTLKTMNSLALAYNAAGRLPEALLEEEILQRCKAKLGPDDPATLRSMNNLVGAYTCAAKFSEAELLSRQVLSSRRKSGGTNATEMLSLANALDNLSECLVLQHKYAEAEPFLRESLAIYETALGKWQKFWSCSSLGKALLRQEKYAEAEPLLMRGYQGLKDQGGQAPGELNKLKFAGQRVVQLYEAWGKANTAAEWRNKLADAKNSR